MEPAEMKEYTHLGETERTNMKTVTIAVDPEKTHGLLDANIYGLHLEHIWNCVYPCLWVGRESEIPNIDGMRADVVELLAALHPTVCKYPGGYFADFYDWRDGVGKDRPVRVCPTQPGREETNHFGTAEFIRFCRLIGAEPFLSVNTTSISPSTAAQWVEYCNGNGGTFWADRRRQDGFQDPFNVRYWAIGNEQYWLHSACEYAHRYKLWSHWMYNADPNLVLVMSGIEPGLGSLVGDPWNGDGTWGQETLRLTSAGHGLFHGRWHPQSQDREILYSLHPYFNAEAECTDEQYYAAFNDLENRLPKSIKTVTNLFDLYRGPHPRLRLCFDEYGLLHPGYFMDGDMTQPAPFWSALWLGCFLHICHEHPEEVGMATLPGTINMEHALIILKENVAVATPSYHVFKMFRPHGGARRIETTVENPPVCGNLDRGCLRVLASRPKRQDRVTISMINLHLEESIPVQIRIHNRKIQKGVGEVLTGPIHAQNSPRSPREVCPVTIEVQIVEGKVSYDLPPHSTTVFEVLMETGDKNE